jgi:hypothetical protein
MAAPRVRPLNDGAKNSAVEVSISLSEDMDWTPVVDLSKLGGTHRRVRIDEIYYAISDKVEVQLAWHHPDGERYEFMPLAGRGRFAFNCVQPSAPSEPNDGHSGNIEIRTIGAHADTLVYLLFDLTKQ